MLRMLEYKKLREKAKEKLPRDVVRTPVIKR